VSPYVADLIEATVAGAETDYDRVAALQQLFRDEANGFVYSEDPEVPGFKAPDALENFLLGKRGFCEQYASAMAAMVRALGIPARVGVGFTPGTRQPDGDLARHDQRRARLARGVVQRAPAGCASSPPRARRRSATPGYTIPPVEDGSPRTPQNAAIRPPALPSRRTGSLRRGPRPAVASDLDLATWTRV
jgi:transglutaminase-like putative cysteine protease